MALSHFLLPLFLLFSAIGATQAELGTTWAVLVAGSNGYENYRHQADICHAYQILKKGGLKDENIVVFMYDDIATHKWNPRPGTIINHPKGSDVYAGVPKDYTGDDVTAANLYAVLLGDKQAVKGGSGKVVDSKADDRIFLYYSDHGGPGVLGMPNEPYVYANDLIATLEKKHASKGYKEMVIYVESCESGSMFQGLLSQDMDVYVTTASGPTEDSWATYCPGMDSPPPPPPEYVTCLGDVYSVAWMEDSQSHNLKKETLEQQYQRVKERTSKFNGFANGSHVMEYGNKSISEEKLFLYQGFDPASENYPPSNVESFGVVNQRDAELVPLWHKYKTSEHGSETKKELLKEFREHVNRRAHLDGSVKLIGEILYGTQRGSSVLDYVRAPGLPLVDDWGCLKTTVRTFEKHCGSLTQYGMKHMRAFANICNSGIGGSMEDAAEAACWGYDAGEWHPSNKGYSA